MSNKMFDRAFRKCYYIAVRKGLAGLGSRIMTKKEKLKNPEYASMLYDFYGALLSESQKEVMSLYHEDNYSLSEIAEELSQTRQAVHYTLKKVEAALAEYEDKLGLVKSYEDNQRLAEKLVDIIKKDNLSDADRSAVTDIVRKITE